LNFSYFFNALSKKDKILSFLLVPLVLFLIFFICKTYCISNNNQDINKQIYILEKAIKKLKYKDRKLNYISYLKYIEKVAKDLEIKVINIEIDKYIFDIQVTGKYTNTINFISTLEERMKVRLLSINKEKQHNILSHISLKIQNYKNKYFLISVDNLPNPFNLKKQYSQDNTLKLIAIVDKDIYINNKWYKKGQKIGKYKIKYIDKTYILITNKNKTIKLELPKDDS
jgi:hypothetical protein